MTKSIRKKNRRLKRQAKGDDPHIQSEGYYPRKKRAEEMTALELANLRAEEVIDANLYSR
jgi:hypothetical protein